MALLSARKRRGIDAVAALGILRQPAIKVAAGVTEAAVLHLRSLAVRLRLPNCEFHQVECKLAELCTVLRRDVSAAENNGPSDSATLQSLPGVGRSTLATSTRNVLDSASTAIRSTDRDGALHLRPCRDFSTYHRALDCG